ncbi:DUF6319 family protein [Tomitella biformata]|uniref:DUF6319 family protein n=1 Tax=Tomitella biformata TaxID=630403 RepID=UPI000466D403|nr:DUF6319 family protein [Tomitella biformata]
MASGTPAGPVNASLSNEELALLAAGLTENKRPTVYLREAIPSLGLPEGSSARVVSISGRSLTVKPRGVADELPFEADEVRFTRKAPAPAKRAPRKAPAKAATVKVPAAKVPAAKVPAAKVPAAKAAPIAAKAPVAPASAPVVLPESTPVKAVPVKATRARRGPASVSVIIEGTADNEWTVSVLRGAKRVGKQASVPADAVGRAVTALGGTASVEVSGLLNAAREQAEQRVADLARQLEEAQRALKSLESGA